MPHSMRFLVRGTLLVLALAMGLTVLAETESTNSNRKALVLGQGGHERDGSPSHPLAAKINFLKAVGNPENDPAKGWTCDLSWDLMERLGMDPKKTTFSALFKYIGEHHLGYRIAMQNFAGGANNPFWADAVDNGIMPFAPHGNNAPHLRLDRPPGLQCCVAVAGGRSECENTYGPSLEFFDAMPWRFSENVEQSWANQMLAAKFAHVLDQHPDFNIWDAREYLRQSASFWRKGWTERNGYGRVTYPIFITGKLLPGPPVEFNTRLSRSLRQVIFTWHNFPMTDFAATVISRGDGTEIYRGTGTNFTWLADHDGKETFTYWSEDKAGIKSRLESYQERTVSGFSVAGKPSVLVLADPGDRAPGAMEMLGVLQSTLTNWICDMACRPKSQPGQWVEMFNGNGPYAIVQPDFAGMVDYAITNRYRILLAPVSEPDDRELSRYSPLWEKAVAAGVAVVVPHNSDWPDMPPGTHEALPARLGAAITVAFGTGTNVLTWGPGQEFFDAAPKQANGLGYDYSANAAAAALAIKLGRVMEANPRYNLWDARQHLRQSASCYAEGWREDGGYGSPPAEPAKLAQLDLAPPLEIQAVKADDGKSVTFSWLNFKQIDFAATLITKADGSKIYEGAGTNFVWRSDTTGEATFKFFTEDKSGHRSRDETYTTVRINGLTSR